MTVNGPISTSEMGTSLVHEHLLVDFIGADSTGYHRWVRDTVAERVMPYLKEIQQFKVSTLFECTPAFVGRDPLLLKLLSDKTGLNLVTNTGYYGAHGNKFIPEEFYNLSAEELSEIWVNEFMHGIEGSGIKPGFIKIAVDGTDRLSQEHLKIITAAALTHQQTGMVIASHTGPDKPAFAQIEVLQSHKIDPSAFIWVHAQRGSLEGNLKAARAGSWISLDNIDAGREPGTAFSMNWYASRILSIKEAGLLHRVLISHDAGWYSPGEEDGGNFRGFTTIFSELLPALLYLGFTQQEVDLLLIENPKKAYGLKKSS